MAAAANSTSRRNFLSSLAAAPAAAALASIAMASEPHNVGRRRWDRRLDRWRRRNALMKADMEFGDYDKACYVFGQCHRDMEERYGTLDAARTHPEGRAILDEAFRIMGVAEAARSRDFVEPAERAAILLALTPAPDLEGAPLKIEVIKEHELHNFTAMPRDPMEIVAADMRRLSRSN